MRITGNGRSGRTSSARPASRPTVSERVTGPSSGTTIDTIKDVTSIMGIPETELTPKVREAIMTLMGEVDRLRREMEETRRRLQDAEAVADQDTLMPILNRRAFVRELSRTISYSQRYKAEASLIYFDLNGFKAVNDRLGHAAGDSVLRHVSGLLLSNVRDSDIVGRLGGDEFGVILARGGEHEAQNKAESLSELIRTRPTVFDGQDIPISVAAGVTAFSADEDPAAAIARADEAMYAKKREAGSS